MNNHTCRRCNNCQICNADATEVAIPKIIALPPISNTIGPKTATVAALLNKFVNIPVRKTDTNHRTIVTS